jgi:hypothetical protein
MRNSKRIDLTNPREFTPENVRAMLAAADDRKRNQIRVTKDGMAYISEEVCGNRDIAGLAFRLETFMPGNGYVGPAAASDSSYADTIYAVLRKNWPRPKSTYIDVW